MVFLFLLAYEGLLLWVAAGRLLELRRAEANRKRLLQRGAHEFYQGHYRWMVLLHGAWLGACALEAYWRARIPPLWMAIPGAVLFLAGYFLRLAAIGALKERWTTRILVLPKEPLIQEGIYRRLRHPNYLGVVLEIAGLPLLGGCWISAVLFSLLHAFLIQLRIRLEERALGI